MDFGLGDLFDGGCDLGFECGRRDEAGLRDLVALAGREDSGYMAGGKLRCGEGELKGAGWDVDEGEAAVIREDGSLSRQAVCCR